MCLPQVDCMTYWKYFLTPNFCPDWQANEMLFCGRKLTAQEACSRGLVSQVFWPTTFNQEVMLRVKEMASCNAVVGPDLDKPEGKVSSWI